VVLFSTGPTSAADWHYRVCRHKVRHQQRTYQVCTRDMQMSVEMATTLSTNCNWWIIWELLRRLFHIGNFCFWVAFFKQLLLQNCAVDFVEICNVCTRKVIIKAAKRISNSDKICRNYCDFYFGVTFFGTHCIIKHWMFSDIKDEDGHQADAAGNLAEWEDQNRSRRQNKCPSDNKQTNKLQSITLYNKQKRQINQLPKLCVKISILRHKCMWVRSFSTRLTSVTFAEDKVPIFLNLRKNAKIVQLWV